MTDSSVTGRNQNHSDVRDESARDNDPLFELSRIFGFEEPTGQTNTHSPQAEPEYSSEISLERELMADFDTEFATEFAAQPLGENFAGQFAEPDNQSEYYQALDHGGDQPPHQASQNNPQDYASQVAAESRHGHHVAQQAVEPRFTGYAPLQRAYAENKSGSDHAVTQEPDFRVEEPHYFEAHQDDFSAVENALSQSFTPAEPAYAHAEQAFDLTELDLPELDLNALEDLGFDEIGREPHHEFTAQSFDVSHDAYGYDNAVQPQAPVQSHEQAPADLSFEDELAFLLHDEAPAGASYPDLAAEQPAYAGYSVPAYTNAPAYADAYTTPVAAALQPPVLEEPVLYDEPLVPETDFAPLFDAPENEFVPVASTFDAQEEAEHDYSNPEPAHNYAPVEDEFFAAPDLTHLPNRTSSSTWEETNVEEKAPVADHSFADLFGATSRASYEAEPEVLSDHSAEPSFYEAEPQAENFSFDDDFYTAESSATEEPVVAPVSQFADQAPQPVSHNAVRGYSNYTFGAASSPSAPVATAATAAFSGSINQVVNNYADAETQVSYAATPEPVASSTEDFSAANHYYEKPAATSEDFFNNDDFDFSFDEEVQPADDYPIAAAVEEEPAQAPELPTYQPSYTSVPKTFAPAPEIEAVAVSENKVEQTQALDLPDVSFGDDAKATGLNSLESEFAEIFSTISVTEAATPDTTSEADKAFENILQDNFADYHASVKADADQAAANKAYGMAAGAAVVGGLAAANAVAGSGARGSASANPAANATQDDYYNHWAAQGAQTNDFDTYNLGDNFSRDEQEFDDYRPREENPLRKPILWASVAAAALIVLGGGYYALKSGGVVGGEPPVLRADSQPVKMQPENAGGTVVPNQDKAVYDQFSGNKPAKPEQKTLINTEEVPVDVGLLQGQDAEEDRLSDEQEDTNATTAPAATNPQDAQRELITPRTVKTMVVRADGTIVPGEAPAVSPEPAPTDTGLDEASRLISQSAVPERLGAETPAAPAQSAAAPRVVKTQSFTASGEQVKPREVATTPIVPSRPAEQPVNVVGNVERPVAAQPQTPAQAPQQVASANVASANVPAGTWFIQVASQPSAELAQKNYANLTSRYGNVIGGRGVDIKKADIPGKGTYYRVRIPGGTKAEAAALCERLKSAGGSCFPTL